MIIEWWERVRRVDRRRETRAVVRSVQSWGLPSQIGELTDGASVPSFRWDTFIKALTIEYRDVEGVAHFKKVWLFSCPSLFALRPGDDFFVQYSPNNSNRLYIRERTQAIFQMVAALMVAVMVFAWTIRKRR